MKKLNFKLTGKRRKLVLSVGAGVLAAAVITGAVFGLRGRGEPVGVYPFTMVGMTEFWGDNQESYGPVTTDKIQTVFLSDTQTITGVLVKQGDQVKKGDVLMTYDTTLSELQLERKRLDVEKAKLQVKEAEEQLQKIRNMQPMSDSGIDFPSAGEDGVKLESDYVISTQNPEFDGSSLEKAIVCWMKEDTSVNNALLRALYYQAVLNQNENAKNVPSSGSAITDESGDDQQNTSITPPLDSGEAGTESGGTGSEGGNTGINGGDTGSEGSNTGGEGGNTSDEEGNTGNEGSNIHGEGESSVPEDDKLDTTPIDVPDAFTLFAMRAPDLLKIHCGDVFENGVVQVTAGDAVNLTFTSNVTDWEHSKYVTWYLSSDSGGPLIKSENGRGCTVSGITSSVTEIRYTVTATYDVAGLKPLEDTYQFTLKVVAQPDEEEEAVNSFYAVLKVTEDDKEKGLCRIWQGLHVTVYDGGGFGFSFVDAPSQDNFFPEDDEDPDFPNIDFGSGMTAAQIAQLRREQEKKIKELAASAKMVEAEYSLMEREFNDGNIRATLDGEVVSLLTEEESRQNKQPMMKVSGGGGFYVEGSVSELEWSKLKLEQEVTINDWNTGNTYTGKVCAIGDFPTTNGGWNGMGNPNASYYPFRVFIDGTADLQEGSYVSVTYSAAEAENGIYLENPFLRTEGGASYVYVRGKNGRLEKRTVTTGKSLWGSYTEIRSGLTEDDYVAFPYGKTVKAGAATVESDLSALYRY